MSDVSDAVWLVGAFGPNFETTRLKPEIRKRLASRNIRLAQEAYQPSLWGNRDILEDDYWDDNVQAPPKARWYHASPEPLGEGTILVPQGGPSKYENYYRGRTDRGLSRRDWVWLEHRLPRIIGNWDHLNDKYVYEGRLYTQC